MGTTLCDNLFCLEPGPDLLGKIFSNLIRMHKIRIDFWKGHLNIGTQVLSEILSPELSAMKRELERKCSDQCIFATGFF
jgi:hypothetical protein